ncbi:MFS transporter [Aureimonas leprariae]|uniref:MFS transporter n=2 Tax=Plantimonas leprariae TaxID=2615207 RepID=A0A7V7TX91_9HYPH|nr:MFS transporter [Aureimonas leprariae]
MAPDARAQFLTMFPSIMLPMFLAVVDQTIVATALPAIAASLGEVDRLSWIVVSYLVATTVAAPVYGRLGDLLGRRRLMLVALGIFIGASVLCALARSIETLTVARVLQGAGGGGLMTLSQALVGEAIPPRERARYQGYLAAVAVSSNAFGPVAGGFLTQHFGWPSVFLVNVPIGIAAAFLALRLPARPGNREPFRFDVLGLFLFAAFITSALIALERARVFVAAGGYGFPLLIVLAAVAAVFLIWRERRARSPLLPIPLLQHAAIWRCDAMAACHGGMLVSLITFLPLYFGIVHGTSASTTGLLMLPMTAGIGIGSLVTGRIVSRTGRTAIFPSVGMTIVASVLALIAFAAPFLPPVSIAAIFGATAIFMGSVMGVVQLTVQLASGPKQLGAGAATVQFSRSLGAALGTALVGTVLFATLAATSPEASAGFARILEGGPGTLATLGAAERQAIREGLDLAFRNAFLCTAVFSGFAAILAWTLPIRRL